MYNMYWSVCLIVQAFMSQPMMLATLASPTFSAAPLSPTLLSHSLLTTWTPPILYPIHRQDVTTMWQRAFSSADKNVPAHVVAIVSDVTRTKIPDQAISFVMWTGKWIGWFDLDLAVQRVNVKIWEVNVELENLFRQRDLLVKGLWLWLMVVAIRRCVITLIR